MSRANSPAVIYPMGQPESSNIDYYRWSKLSGEKREKAKNKSMVLMRNSYALASKVISKIRNTDVPDAEEIIAISETTFIENQSKPELFIAKQMVADYIQRTYFPISYNEGDLDKKNFDNLNQSKLELLSYITNLYVTNGNPNADLIAFNLKHLQNTVPEEKLSYFAEESIENTKNWYGEEYFCDTCKTKALIENNLKLQNVKSGLDLLAENTQ